VKTRHLHVITGALGRVPRAAMRLSAQPAVRRALSSSRRPGRHLDGLVVRELRHRGTPGAVADGVDVSRDVVGGVAVLSVTGEIDIASAPALRDALRTEVDEGSTPVVVDFTATELLGSPGAHLLLNAHRRLTRRQRAFAVVAPEGSSARRTLESARLLDTLSVQATREAAVGATDPGALSSAA